MLLLLWQRYVLLFPLQKKGLNQPHCFVVAVMGFWRYDNHKQKYNAYSCKRYYFEMFA